MKSLCDMRYEDRPVHKSPEESRMEQLQTYCENLEDRIEQLEKLIEAKEK